MNSNLTTLTASNFNANIMNINNVASSIYIDNNLFEEVTSGGNGDFFYIDNNGSDISNLYIAEYSLGYVCFYHYHY
jgi:hypothetical protein